jgi:hypothetical protein
MNKYVFASLATAAALAAPSVAFACTEISSFPATIGSPGNYCLTADNTTADSAEHTIEINSHNVTLDCQGHTLTSTANSDAGTSAAVYALNKHDVTIRNCRIMGGYTAGIQLQQVNSGPNYNYYATISDNYIAGPYLYGILAYGSALEITGNHVYDIGGQVNTFAAGIRTGAGTGFAFHVIKDNVVAGTNSPYNNSFGILSDKSIASLVTGNTVVAGGANASYRNYGIRFLSGGTNRVSGNHVIGSAQTNNTGIMSTDASTACYDNFIRSGVNTSKCSATLGNY